MTEDERGARLGGVETRWNRELPRQKTAGPRRINEEIRAQLEWRAVPRAAQADGIRRDVRRRQVYAIPVVDTGGDCLAHEMVIDVRAHPV